MYRYDNYDQTLVDERVAQFRAQTERFLAGKLSETEFLPLRLQNGLYVQRLAPMLRIAVPYGMLSSTQVRKLAAISRDYDKGYIHFTTRQNAQLNWPKLEEVPDILAELASVEMHAIQTSGNCIRNTTTDQFAGVAADELVDPRPYCEIIRQWSTLHPEFAFLPRKFKIAVNAAESDRAATQFHDIGIEIVKRDGEIGFKILVGGGLGRTPVIATEVKDFVARKDLLNYLDAVLRVYNQLGRRDNKYKARIKILVRATGAEKFSEMVEHEFKQGQLPENELTDAEIARVSTFFTAPDYKTIDGDASAAALAAQADDNKAFALWLQRNVKPHKMPGYANVTLSLKPTGIAPGDASDKQLEAAAQLADDYAFGEMRVSHEQNLILTDVEESKLLELWQKARAHGFATPNIGTITDIICCPGGDFCALANAKSIPIADSIQRRIDELDYHHDLGEIDLNISGCMNACAHHHVGHIGILGVDKKGREFYQVQLGGNAGNEAALGKVLGPAFAQDEMPDVVEKLMQTYVDQRIEGETFLQTYQRIGMAPFKERVYAAD